MKHRHFKPGIIVKHFKRELLTEQELKVNPYKYLYKVIGEAIHTETNEQLLIYQAEYGYRQIFARPLEEAMGLVDKEKYPDVKQEYRLEPFNKDNAENEFLWNSLEPHINHDVSIAAYVNRDTGETVDVCLECNDCGEVILDAETHTLVVRSDFNEE